MSISMNQYVIVKREQNWYDGRAFDPGLINLLAMIP